MTLEIQHLLNEFKDIFVDYLPVGLPSLRNILHQIDLIPGSSDTNEESGGEHTSIGVT